MRKLFGTDGIRGVANKYPLDPITLVSIGRAIALFFKEKNESGKNIKVLIGKDTRISGYMIENALTAGLCSEGVDVLLVGPMPTPAIAHLTKSFNADAGIVISASHNPYQDNGIKIFSNQGFKLADAEELEIENLIENCPNTEIQNEKIGKAQRINDSQGRYVEFAKSSIQNRSLKGLKIILDCANGAAYKVAPEIFSELGAQVITIHDNPNGLNINDNCGALHTTELKKRVIAEDADIGLALDGDADRLIVIDDLGNEFDGDKILALCAIVLKEKGKLKENKIATTVMSNFGLIKALKEEGIDAVQTDVGDRYVLAEMQRQNISLGGEQSGHMIFLDYATTGDGIISALQILQALKDKNKRLSEFGHIMTALPQAVSNVEVKTKRPMSNLTQLSKAIKNSENKLAGKGRILVRYSGTQNVMRIMVEGESKADIQNILKELTDIAKKEVGV